MARKKTTTSKKKPKAASKAKPPKAPAPPALSIYQDDDAFGDFDLERPLTLPDAFFVDLFEDQDCLVHTVDEGLFFAMEKDGFHILVETSDEIPFVTFKFPLKVKPRLSKAKVFDWINQCMIDYPMIRILEMQDGIWYSTFDFIYDANAEFDVEYFMMCVEMFWSLNMAIIEEHMGTILTFDGFPFD